jgi:Carboxypeptidase regulatory-like domain
VRSILPVAVALALTALPPAVAAAAVGPSATIAGTVTLTAADGGTWAGDGARVTLACRLDRTTTTVVADDQGAFHFVNVPADTCSIEANMQGFAARPLTVVVAAEQVVGIELHLADVPLRVGVNVGGATPARESQIQPGPSRPDAGRRPASTRCRREGREH